MSNIKIIFLGGQDENFKNMIAVEIDDDIFVVEAGCKFPDKTKHGIDYIIPKYDYLLAHKDKVRAYFITEGNDVVFGALPFIYDKIPAPIVCTRVTRIFLYTFCEHNNINPSHYKFKIVEPSDDIEISGHKIRFFSTCSNIAQGCGLAFDTDQGNIVFALNFVIDNNVTTGFVTDLKKMGVIGDKPTLVLLADSIMSERSGYSNPAYKLRPRIEELFIKSYGRIFLALESPDVYNLIECLKMCAEYRKKVVLYDETTHDLVNRLVKANLVSLPADMIMEASNINRVRAADIVVIMTGFGTRLLHKVSLLAKGQQDNKVITLNSDDVFVVGFHQTNATEIDYFDALDELHRCSVKVINFKKNDLITMHPSMEDLKTILSVFRPKYYVPISGYLVTLFANAMLAVNMGIGLNHTNVFAIDNGHVLLCQNGTCKISSEKLLADDVLVDKNEVSQYSEQIINERRQISDDGVVILAAVVDRNKREIVSGVDVQTRGLVYAKDSDALLREIETIFVRTIKEKIQEPVYDVSHIEQMVRESVLSSIRRHTLKTPLIIANILEIK